MKKVYKISMAAVAAIIFSFSASSTFAQCVQITCPANITVAADTVSCGALVNYTMPVVVDTCVADADTFFFTGAMQTFTVPAGVTSVSFDVRGAQGSNGITGPGGLGARMQGAFAVTPGDVFDILVGQQGLDNHISPGHTGRSTGGGGGSFVVLASTPMIIAGGGGGTGNISPGINASTGTSGENSLGSPVGTGGAGGNGGGADAGMNGGGSGGGFTTDGGVPAGDGGTSPNRGGKAYVNGGAGGDNGQHSGGGGFGGGAGGGNYGGGGGGGYSGGGGGASNGYGGGGGGSYNTGTAQVNTAGYQTGNGMVIVSWAGSPVPVTVSSGLPSGSVFPQGTSTVTLLADNGAGGVDSCSFTVTVTGTAVANADVADTVACSTDGAISLNGTPAGGTWSGAGVTGSSFSPSAAGVGVHIVSYAYTNALGCSDTASASINVLGCGGIGETGNWQLVAYPNPAQNFTSIDFGTDYNHIEINMMDIHGKLVRTAHYENASSVKISLENISAGTYFINVKADNKNTVIKIFKD